LKITQQVGNCCDIPLHMCRCRKHD